VHLGDERGGEVGLRLDCRMLDAGSRFKYGIETLLQVCWENGEVREGFLYLLRGCERTNEMRQYLNYCLCCWCTQRCIPSEVASPVLSVVIAFRIGVTLSWIHSWIRHTTHSATHSELVTRVFVKYQPITSYCCFTRIQKRS
jgi:hypothetical protein